MDLSCRLTRLFNLTEWDVIHFMKILNFLFCASAVFLGLHGKHGTVTGHFPSNSLPQPALHIEKKMFSPLCFQDGLNHSWPFDPYMNFDKGIRF